MEREMLILMLFKTDNWRNLTSVRDRIHPNLGRGFVYAVSDLFTKELVN